MKPTIALLPLVFLRASGGVVPETPHQADLLVDATLNKSSLGSNAHAQLVHRITPRAPREKCSPPVYDGDDQKRDLDGDSVSNGTLWRRMILPADSEAMEAFILHETGDDEEGRTRGFPIIWERRDKGGATDFNTAILSTYAEYKGEFSYMARELMGCTVLAVISRTGFYFAHYWENVSFDPDDDILKKRKRTKEKQFQMTVLEPLNDGWPKSDKAAR